MRPLTLVVVVLALATAAGLAAAGDPAAVERIVFTIEGMHCDGCSAAIVGALQRLDGVIEASADHEKGEAVAVYLRRKVSVGDLEQAIEKLGYTVTATETAPADE
jgi:copper chaperone CopZ